MALVVDAFAGAGGWDEGARLAGYGGPLVGIDTDLAACRTAMAAGHARVCADVATYPLERLAGRVTGLVASPPCQGWSTAGSGGGRMDRVRCHALVDAYAAGGRLPAGTWTDPGSPLVAEPVRWVRALRPRWVALEQVPPVLPLWQHIAHVLRRWGYRAWCGILAAEAYGVPQTRRRAILTASLDGPVGPPEPTHQQYRAHRPPRTDADLFGAPLPPPESMAEALDWDADHPARTLANGRQPNATRRDSDEPAPTIYCSRPGNLVVDVGQGSRLADGSTERYTRPVSEPSPTVVQAQRWTVRPATTVQGDPRIWPPGHKVNTEDIARLGEDGARDRYGDRAGTDAVRVSVVEAAILQGFRPDYPWRGTKTAQFCQVGNAIPPPLAAAVLRPLLALADHVRGAA